MFEGEIPDRVKHSDLWLEWISNYRKGWEKRLAREETERADTEWIAMFVATMAGTMENAPVARRREIIREINSVMTEAGLWPPVKMPELTD